MAEAVRQRGFRSVSSFVRHALQNELRQGDAAAIHMEERIIATIARLASEVRAVHTAQMATYALADTLAKVILTCLPEPQGEVLEQAKSRGKRRYERFLVSVAQGMAGDSKRALEQLSRVND
jgi:Arc/MetJ-type ribon-helix-helix transcriptional regulator